MSGLICRFRGGIGAARIVLAHGVVSKLRRPGEPGIRVRQRTCAPSADQFPRCTPPGSISSRRRRQVSWLTGHRRQAPFPAMGQWFTLEARRSQFAGAAPARILRGEPVHPSGIPFESRARKRGTVGFFNGLTERDAMSTEGSSLRALNQSVSALRLDVGNRVV